jgi:hypothetical protein
MLSPLLLLVLGLHITRTAAFVSGVKATYTNAENASQSFVALLAKPRVMTFTTGETTIIPLGIVISHSGIVTIGMRCMTGVHLMSQSR